MLLGICGRYYNLIQSFFDNSHQRVVVNGQSSKWSLVEAGVPQGSILASLLFLVYIKDLSQGLRFNTKLSDTSLFSTITSHSTITRRVRTLVVSDLRSETRGSRFESSC